MAKTPKATSPLSPPKVHRDGTWQVKISRAHEARTAAQQMRKGKPATLSTRRVHKA